MLMNLGERIKNQGIGIYYGETAECLLRWEDTLFGIEDGKLLAFCHPRNNISRWSLRYWRLPSEFKKVLTDPNNSKLLRRNKPLFFLHYSIDKKRVIKGCKNRKPPIDYQVIDSKNLESAIYSNFLGETLYVGDKILMQETVAELKGGFHEALGIASNLVKSNIAESRIARYNELIICDTIHAPRYVYHER